MSLHKVSYDSKILGIYFQKEEIIEHDVNPQYSLKCILFTLVIYIIFQSAISKNLRNFDILSTSTACFLSKILMNALNPLYINHLRQTAQSI